jgi:hypothetical protein
MLSSPQRARGVRETKAEVLRALDACEAALEEAEAAEASETREKSGDERAPPMTHDSPSDKEEHERDPLCDSYSDASSSSPRFSDLELSDEEEETREFSAASFAEALAKESRKKVDVARDARSVAAAAAAIADAATRGIDVCERAVAELERELVYGDARKSEENADVARGNDNDSSTSAAFDEEEEDAAAAAAAADAVPLRMTPRETVPGPSKDAVLSAYIPKRLDRRHKRTTTPPKLKKQEKAEKQKAETAVSRDGVMNAASRDEHPRTRSADLFADFAFAGTQKK